MAIGRQFLSLITDLRAEVRRSTSVSVGVDDLDNLKRVLNHVYRSLVVDHEWPHLRVVAAKIQMAAGQRYYDVPTELEFDGITSAVVWDGTETYDIERGIDLADYGVLDPEEDEREDPIRKFDLRFNGTAVVVEVWPIPNSDDCALQFKGNRALDKLVNDTDKCWLDDELVLSFAAAEILAAVKAEDAESKLRLAQGYLQRLKARSKGVGKRYSMGLGSATDTSRPQFGAQVNIKASSG